MKKIIVFITTVLLSLPLAAQLTTEQRIQDSVIGWWSNNYWDRSWKPQTDPVGRAWQVMQCDLR